MRILFGLLGFCLAFFIVADAVAKCRPDALGTSRNIVLDPKKHRSINGKERSLGLRKKEVILTFDDGPIAGRTSRILKALQDECVKATFFYVGTMARANPKLVRKVVRQGHTLAHHTHSHNRLPKYSTAKVGKLIDRGVRSLQKIAYNDASATPRVPFFRYPYLARSKRTDKVLAKKGLIAIGANIDSLDWKKSSPKKLHDRIMRKVRREGRGIILMHDIQTRTAKMLPSLLRSLKKEGYKVVHLVSKPRAKTKSKPLLMASLRKSTHITDLQAGHRRANQLSKSTGSRGLMGEGQRRTMRNIPKHSRQTTHATTNQSSNGVRRSNRLRVPVLFKMARYRRPKSVTVGKLKLRRSQWILR